MNNKYHIEEYTSTHSLTHSLTTVLMPLPSYGFDPTESAIPWKYLTSNNYRVVIATPHGAVAHVDHRMYTGHDLGLLKPLLMADSNGTAAYTEFKNSHEFLHPISYDSIDTTRFDALLLPGGHDKGMREYLESRVLQVKVAEFFEAQKPVGAICHGVVLASRSTYKDTGVSVLWGRLTTCLTKSQELVAYNLTRCYLGDYYLTYPNTTVEDEVKSRLKDPEIHYNGGADLFIPLERDSPDSLQCGFAAVHGNYVSARWPGDAHLFSIRFLEVIYNRMEKIATDK